MKKISGKRMITIIIICVLAAGAGVLYVVRSHEPEYIEATAETKNLSTYYSYEGNIEAKDSQIAYATSTCTIKRIYVSEGDTVSKGDLLYELEGANTQARFTQAQAALEAAKIASVDAQKNKERITELYQAGAVSRTDYEQAQSGFETALAKQTQAEADYETARNDADDLKVYADIDGEVSDIYAEENKTVVSGTEIMDVLNYNLLLVKIKIDEFDLSGIKEGADAVVDISALDKEVNGTVSTISKKAEVVNGVSYFNAEIALSPDEALKVGLSTEVKIQRRSQENAVTVPMEAIQFDSSNNPYVIVKSADGAVASQAVKVGINDGRNAEITEGLKTGDKILIEKQNSNVETLPAPTAENRIVNRASKNQSN